MAPAWSKILLWALVWMVAALMVPFARAQQINADFRTACWNGDVDHVAALLQRGIIRLEERDAFGRTPLLLASHGNSEIVKLLLSHGAQIDAAEKDGDTSLCIAAEHDQLVNAQLLLARGAEINHVNQYGRTPLCLAAKGGYDDLVAYLLGHHADLTAGDPRSSPLCYAAWQDHISTARLLLAAGSQISVPEIVKKSGQPWGSTMLTAVGTGDRALIDLLLDHGGDINEPDSGGRSAFFLLMQTSHDVPLVTDILNRGADPNRPDRHGATPFFAAVTYANPAILQLLVQHGANVNVKDEMGLTGLMVACSFNALKKVQELLIFHPDVNLQDNAGETALTYAGDRGAVEIVQILEEAGAKPQPFHIILKPTREVLTKPQLWALAVGAVYAQYNGFNPQSLAQSSDKKTLLGDELESDWGVTTRDQLFAVLHRLERKSTWIETVTGQLLDAAASPTWIARLLRTRELLLMDLREPQLNVAWNACREANLIRSAVTAGYLDEQEAWPLLLRNASRVQNTYNSWQEMNRDFLESREIWAGEKNPDFRACADLLLNPKDPNSPWNQLPWQTDLAGN